MFEYFEECIELESCKSSHSRQKLLGWRNRLYNNDADSDELVLNVWAVESNEHDLESTVRQEISNRCVELGLQGPAFVEVNKTDLDLSPRKIASALQQSLKPHLRCVGKICRRSKCFLSQLHVLMCVCIVCDGAATTGSRLVTSCVGVTP